MEEWGDSSGKVPAYKCNSSITKIHAQENKGNIRTGSTE
jgi:hypothetical protein